MQTTPIRATDSLWIPRPAADVWRVLADVHGYPGWWPPELRVRVVGEGGARDVAIEIHPRGGRPFQCRLDGLDEPTSIRLRYFGFVEGQGAWELAPGPGGTQVTYMLDVRAAGLLVGLVARLTDLNALHSGPMRKVLAALRDHPLVQ